MFNIGFSELLLILLIAFVIVGPKDLPKVARWLGRAVKRLRRMMAELKSEIGLDELEKEAAEVKRETQQIRQELDVTGEMKDAADTLRRNLKEAKQSTEGQ